MCALGKELEKILEDKKARAKIKAFIDLETELKEGWKRNFLEKRDKKRGVTL